MRLRRALCALALWHWTARSCLGDQPQCAQTEWQLAFVDAPASVPFDGMPRELKLVVGLRRAPEAGADGQYGHEIALALDLWASSDSGPEVHRYEMQPSEVKHNAIFTFTMEIEEPGWLLLHAVLLPRSLQLGMDAGCIARAEHHLKVGQESRAGLARAPLCRRLSGFCATQLDSRCKRPAKAPQSGQRSPVMRPGQILMCKNKAQDTEPFVWLLLPLTSGDLVHGVSYFANVEIELGQGELGQVQRLQSFCLRFHPRPQGGPVLSRIRLTAGCLLRLPASCLVQLWADPWRVLADPPHHRPRPDCPLVCAQLGDDRITPATMPPDLVVTTSGTRAPISLMLRLVRLPNVPTWRRTPCIAPASPTTQDYLLFTTTAPPRI